MRLFRFRLLPITMLVAFLALGLKVGEVMHDGHSIIVSLTSAQAETVPEQAKPAEAGKDKKPEEAKKEEPAKTDANAKPPAEGQSGDADEPEEDDKKKKREFSQVEVDILQSLAQRRQELDGWSKQVQLKENMLIATEQRINEKIDNLQKMKKEIENLLALYNEQEDTKIRSLVKIYENMKPKDAARIFEELDMPVLLIVVDRMSERKVSPILAGMSPQKAKDLTVQLAEQRKLQKPSSNSSSPPPAAENATAPGTTDSAGSQPAPSPAPAGTTPPADATAAPTGGEAPPAAGGR